MVFPRTKYPASYENSSLHISAIEGKNNLSFFKERKPGMKRPAEFDSSFNLSKRKRFNSTPFFMKEEISEADFQMYAIKQSLASKKDWVYRQVLEKLGVQPSSGHNFVRKDGCFLSRTQGETTHLSQRNSNTFVHNRDGNKVHDEDGNCYIDEEDFKSFYRPKERSSTDDYSYTQRRNLNFTFHGSNGGVAIDHQTLPKVMGIHSVPRRGVSDNDHRSQSKHVKARFVGSKLSPVDKHSEKEEKWWPPSPESITDETSREGDGLLKVMTPDDMKAYGLPKQETQENTVDDSDVIVTQVLKRDDLDNNMPPLQLDADGKPSNYKEILLHYITQQVKNNPQNPSLNKITKDAMAGNKKNMNMEELCQKLLNTRAKLEKEQMKWKRKLLCSLEVVLMKKIHRLEVETGVKAPEEINHQKPVRSEQSSGSQSDIVAVMEDLTDDVSEPRAKKNIESNGKYRTVSVIRGYESS